MSTPSLRERLLAGQKLLVIAGPTASGKTALGVALAERFGGEVIGADSVQIYKHFEIGSARPLPEEMRGIPHHLVGACEPDSHLDAVGYAGLADRVIAEVRARNRVPIVVGGTGLWLRALLRGLLEAPPVDPLLRRALEEKADLDGDLALYAELARVDPLAAEKIHPNDRLRVVRALEVFAQTGTPMGELRRAHALGAARYDALTITLEPTPEELLPRIEERTAQMIRRGFADEVRQLLATYGPSLRALGSVGYREMCAHVRGELPLEETVAQIVRSTRLYARRQRNWFRTEPTPFLRARVEALFPSALDRSTGAEVDAALERMLAEEGATR